MKSLSLVFFAMLVVVSSFGTAVAQNYCYTPRCKQSGTVRPVVINKTYRMNGVDSHARKVNETQSGQIANLQVSKADQAYVDQNFNGMVQDIGNINNRVTGIETRQTISENNIFWYAVFLVIAFIVGFIGWFLPRQAQPQIVHQQHQQLPPQQHAIPQVAPGPQFLPPTYPYMVQNFAPYQQPNWQLQTQQPVQQHNGVHVPLDIQVEPINIRLNPTLGNAIAPQT